MLARVVSEHGLRRQHLEQAAEAAHERDFARLPILVWLRTSQFGKQLHFHPIEGPTGCAPCTAFRHRHSKQGGLIETTEIGQGKAEVGVRKQESV